MPYGKILIAALDIYFAISEKMNKTKEEQLAFYTEQRVRFRSENAPENLPEPPDLSDVE